MGYVQFPQLYYNQSASWIARGAAEETYQFYSMTQSAAHAGGWPNMVGCHNVHRASALQEIGGFAPHDADDLLTGLMYQRAGWRGVYDRSVVAKGLTPTAWGDYLKQQSRWARSVFDVKLRVQPRLHLGLSWVEQALSYVLGLAYLQCLLTALGVVLVASLLATNVPMFEEDWGLWVLGSLVLLAVAIRGAALLGRRVVLERRERGVHWRAMLLNYAKFPLQLAALWDVVRGRDAAEYVLTRKVAGAAGAKEGRVAARVVFWPHLAVLVVLVVAATVGIARGVGVNPVMAFFAVWIGGMSLIVLVSERTMTDAPPYDPAIEAGV